MFPGELALLQQLQYLRNGFFNNLFELITMLGEEVLLVLLIISLWFSYDKHLARKIFFITTVSLSINSILKNFLRIPRPFSTGKITCVRPDTATGYSFPSGHTQNFATWSSTLTIAFKKKWFSILINILIFLVAFSRLFLGAHYPSDVICGGVLGIILAHAGNALCNKVLNKKRMYLITLGLLTPFTVIFLIFKDPLFEDFYKFYGILAGLYAAVAFEEKYAPISYDVSWQKKIIRIITGTFLALIIEKGIDLTAIISSLEIYLIADTIKHILLVFVVFGLCPLVFKKLKL